MRRKRTAEGDAERRSPSRCVRALAFVLSFAIVVPTAAAAQDALPSIGLPGGSPGVLPALPFNEMFGINSNTGLLSADDAFGIVDSSFSLADIDPFTGFLGDASGGLMPDLALQMNLMEDSLLALDTQRLAQRALEEARRKKAAEEAAAKRKGIAMGRRTDGYPESWQLKSFSSCGSASNTRWTARIETVDAFEEMCQAAAREGVSLTLNSAYRDPARQKELFDQAVRKYGSTAAARKWVAYSDGSGCTSKHCAGIALDISSSDGAHTWLHRPVGCASDQDGFRPGAGRCPSGMSRIIQAQLFGFIAPLAHEPWHVELGIPLVTDTLANPSGEAVAGDCTPPGSYTVPQMVAAIFRCRLDAAGIRGAEQKRIVAEALVVAKCESGFKANAIAFGGKFVSTPHPNGNRYTASGVFQFIRSSADKWISGGYRNARDPVANIDAAARYFLSGYRGNSIAAWRPWACVSNLDGFNKRSVLPGGPGGPARLPDWAFAY